MITTSRADWADRARRLREHAMSVSAADRHASVLAPPESYAEVGFNFRMTDMQAAVGLVQLGRLPEMVARRRELAATYAAAVAELPGLRIVADPAYGTTNFQSCWIEVLDEHPLDREELMMHLAEAGISARRGIMAAHRQPAHAHREHDPAAGDRAAQRPDADPAAVPPDDRRRAVARVRRARHCVAAMTGLLLVGASGLAREATAVAVMLQHDGPINIVDDNPATWGTLHGLTPVLGSVDLVAEVVDFEVLLALGAGGTAGAWPCASTCSASTRRATPRSSTRGSCCPAAATSAPARSCSTGWCSPPTSRSATTSC